MEGSSFVVLFSQDVQFELFGGQKPQKEHLEKRFGGSIPGGSWKRFSYPSVLNHTSPYTYFFKASAKIKTSTHNDAFPASFDEQILEWKDPVLLFYFLKTSNLSFLAAKNSKKSILRKGLVARFLVGPGNDSLTHRY